MGLFDFWRKKPEPKKAERMTLADFAYADKQAVGTIMQIPLPSGADSGEWLRVIGHEQSDLLREPGIAFVVRSVALDYLKPARLDDLLTVSLEVERITKSQIFFGQHIRRAMPDSAGEEELLSGRVQIVCVNAAKMKITSIPVELRTQLEALQ